MDIVCLCVIQQSYVGTFGCVTIILIWASTTGIDQTRPIHIKHSFVVFLLSILSIQVIPASMIAYKSNYKFIQQSRPQNQVKCDFGLEIIRSDFKKHVTCENIFLANTDRTVISASTITTAIVNLSEYPRSPKTASSFKSAQFIMHCFIFLMRCLSM